MQEPLRKITTFSDRLSEKYKAVLTGDGSMYLSRMTAAAENMRILINDLLEFSRISKTKLPFRNIDLNAVVQDVKSDLEVALEESGAVINSQRLPELEGIETQMKQLFTNILGNAVKFRKAGVAPVINIDAALLSRDESIKYELAPGITYYKIQVTDNGIGFEAEYATRIFQVFQRLHGKSEYPGTGIGLAICKKIVEYHQGLIYAESLPDAGARFVLVIPQNQPQQKATIV
jgi:light-regulated signal transduction histidine kinase (bacteriophytochrome)